MSTDYFIKVHRKDDDKVIAEVLVNELKCVFDSCAFYNSENFSKIIHCDEGRGSNNVKFTPGELSTLIDRVKDVIELKHASMYEKKMLFIVAKTKTAIETIEEDISSLNEDISHLYDVHAAAAMVYGKISAVVEDIWDGKKKKSAYEYNAKGLEGKDSVWNSDVYCELIASF